MLKNREFRNIIGLFLIPLFLTGTSYGQSSTNYTIEKFVLDQGGKSSSSPNYTLIDAIGQPSPVGTAVSTNYSLASGFLTGQILPTDVEENEPLAVPLQFRLLQNYPNPFNPQTAIEYHLPTESEVVLTVYDVMGHVVKQLVHATVSSGVHIVHWNGQNQSGQPVASGIYFLRIDMNGMGSNRKSFTDIKKMIFMK